VRAARPRVHGGIGGVATAPAKRGGVAGKHRVRAGIVALVHRGLAAWLLGSMAAWPMRSRGRCVGTGQHRGRCCIDESVAVAYAA